MPKIGVHSPPHIVCIVLSLSSSRQRVVLGQCIDHSVSWKSRVISWNYHFLISSDTVIEPDSAHVVMHNRSESDVRWWRNTILKVWCRVWCFILFPIENSLAFRKLFVINYQFYLTIILPILLSKFTESTA